jgi:hypothetical protein
MSSLFHKQIPLDEPAQESAQVQSMFVENAHTNTFGWVLAPVSRGAISPALTLEDRRELATNRPPLNNTAVNVKAKIIYAAGGKAKRIAKECGISIDYAKKLHAAFGRALKK